MADFPLPPGRLHEVAYRQKMALYALPCVILVSVLSVWSARLDQQPNLPLALPLEISIQVASIAMIGFAYWAWYILGMTLGLSQTLVILSGILLCVPCVSIVSLLVLTREATKLLRAAGVRVGLLGADLGTIPRDR